MRDVLTELLRLYDWRFELAEREKDPRNVTDNDFKTETRRLLNQYGMEKKAAWEAARIVLASQAMTRCDCGGCLDRCLWAARAEALEQARRLVVYGSDRGEICNMIRALASQGRAG